MCEHEAYKVMQPQGLNVTSFAFHHDGLWAREEKEGRVQKERNKTNTKRKKKEKP